MGEFETRVRQDTEEIYMRLDDEQSIALGLGYEVGESSSAAAARPDEDRRAHAYTRHLMETEARLSREAWVRSTDASDLVHGEVMSLRTTVLGQMTKIRELHAADRRRQIGQVIALQTQVTALQGQQGLAEGPTQPELPEETAHDALRSTNGDDSHNSGTGVRRTERATRE
nr:hypothetical protein [Tanacetum cinerariifolium]